MFDSRPIPRAYPLLLSARGGGLKLTEIRSVPHLQFVHIARVVRARISHVRSSAAGYYAQLPLDFTDAKSIGTCFLLCFDYGMEGP